MSTVLSIAELDRLWMQLLSARSARIKVQKQENDLVDRFSREARRTAEAAASSYVYGISREEVSVPLLGEENIA